MLPAGGIRRHRRWCEATGVRLISDEIYHGLSYGAVGETTAAALSASAIVVNSFRKYFSMTGWRIGWLVLPEDLVRPVECLAQNLFITPPRRPGGGRGGLRLPRGAGGQYRRATAAPATRLLAGAAGGGVRPALAGRWRLLPLGRYRAPDQ